MKGPADVAAAASRRLSATWHLEVAGAPSAWPHPVTFGRPGAAQLEAEFDTHVAGLERLRDFATGHGLDLQLESRRVFGTPQQVPARVIIPTLQAAAAVAGDPWPATIARGRKHLAAIASGHPGATDIPAAVRELSRMSDTDVELAFTAASWFTRHRHEVAGMTPRQVPVEGLHAKWLNTRRALVANLAGLPDLGLQPAHPPRVHVTYLDPAHRDAGGRAHDCFSLGDSAAPPYPVAAVVISENKDTAVAFPPVPGGVAIEGEGRGARTIAALPWLAGVPAIFYWGDMDQDGLEILNEFRATGLDVRSLLMDLDSYEQYRPWGSSTDTKGAPVPVHPARPVPHLYGGELELYRRLCDPHWDGPRRIEQERIPLSVAAALVVSDPDRPPRCNRTFTEVTAAPPRAVDRVATVPSTSPTPSTARE